MTEGYGYEVDPTKRPSAAELLYVCVADLNQVDPVPFLSYIYKNMAILYRPFSAECFVSLQIGYMHV